MHHTQFKRRALLLAQVSISIISNTNLALLIWQTMSGAQAQIVSTSFGEHGSHATGVEDMQHLMSTNHAAFGMFKVRFSNTEGTKWLQRCICLPALPS